VIDGASGKKEVSKTNIFRLILVGMVAVSIVFLYALHRYVPIEWEIRRAILAAFADALLVAALLGATVDKYVKAFLIQEASRDVYRYLAGYNLPEEIKERLQTLMGTALIRHNWRIAYTLTPIVTESNEVLIDVVYSFELQNISNDVQKYTQKIQIEKHLNPTILELRCDDPESGFRRCAAAGGTLGKDQVEAPGVIEATAPEIKVKPSGKNCDLRYPFSGHYQLRTPGNHSDTFSFTHPSIGVTITATHPVGYKFSIEPEGDTVVTDDMWQFRKRAFLRSEHVRVRWFKDSSS
jgi:hypothetical protein